MRKNHKMIVIGFCPIPLHFAQTIIAMEQSERAFLKSQRNEELALQNSSITTRDVEELVITLKDISNPLFVKLKSVGKGGRARNKSEFNKFRNHSGF